MKRIKRMYGSKLVPGKDTRNESRQFTFFQEVYVQSQADENISVINFI